jgi:hypothetical protein
MEEKNSKPTKEELIAMLEMMIENIEKLPPNALITPINHYDYSAGLILISALFKSL